MKLLAWAVLIFAVIWVLRSKAKARAKAQEEALAAARRAQQNAFVQMPDTEDAEAMVSCVQCGVHFPASEAVYDDDRQTFCSTEHRQLHNGR